MQSTTGSAGSAPVNQSPCRCARPGGVPSSPRLRQEHVAEPGLPRHPAGLSADSAVPEQGGNDRQQMLHEPGKSWPGPVQRGLSAPCVTVAVFFGLLLWARPPVPKYLRLVPLAWSLGVKVS